MYTIHYTPDTASMVVRIVLTELGVPAKHQLIDREAGMLDTPAYRAMNPLGQVPAFETPDGPMFETAAILLYLADKHNALAPAVTSPQRAAFLKWYFFISFNIHPTLMQLFYPERVAGADHVAPVVAAARERMATYLSIFDAMVAAEKPDWFSPNEPSIMGHYIGMLMRWLAVYGPGHHTYFDLRDYRAIGTVLAMHEMRPAAQKIAQFEELGAMPYTNPVS